MTVANTIFGALFGARKVSWGLVIQELVDKLVSGLQKGKPSSISSYLFHLYHRFECLNVNYTKSEVEGKFASNIFLLMIIKLTTYYVYKSIENGKHHRLLEESFLLIIF